MNTLQINTYIDASTLPLPFCPGCGHNLILKKLDKALVDLQLNPKKVVIVTDIGCVGLSDKYFITNAFHGLHGRSITYATGIKLADPGLNVIVLMGDGGCGIGGHHLINAARRNIGIAVLVFNNLNYGMTGGEHSVTSPHGAITSTTLNGNVELPMDICGTVSVNGGSFVARSTAYDNQLSELIARAVTHQGFALIDIWEMCTAYYVPNNKFNKKRLEKTMSALNFESGLLEQHSRPELSQILNSATSETNEEKSLPPKPISLRYQNSLSHTESIIIAGAAGAKIASSAEYLCKAAILSGLYASQRNDYMVTVKSGYSISEIILDKEKIPYKSIEKPNHLIITFQEGLSKLEKTLIKLLPNDEVYIDSSLLPIDTPAKVYSLDFRKTKMKKEYWTMIAIGEFLRRSKLFPIEALLDAISTNPKFAVPNIEALKHREVPWKEI
jgi:pyruvate/2-oxoacid:ferredoxin oxidoreductase beta subunit/Pyruvate/2-oxoacid:ferredoxin oxidoreductase gamma subunit